MKEITDQVALLTQKASTFANAHGASVVSAFEKESEILVHWLSYLSTSQRTGIADSLLAAAISSTREAAACLSLGLVRPALFSLRTQIDLILAWLYFKDHPIEWKTVNDLGNGYKLKREVLEFLGEHYRGFSLRYQILKEVNTRTAEDSYRLLSAHIHAQSNPALPVANNLVDVVRDSSLCIECTVLAREVAEYLSDVLTSVYGPQWTALPAPIRKAIDHRLTKKKVSKERFYATI